jgi:type I restriction enzyme S subunit
MIIFVNFILKLYLQIGKVISEVNCQDKELLSVYLDRGVIKFSDVTEKRTNVTSEDLSKYQAVKIGNLVLNNQQAWRGSVGVSKYSGIVSPAYIVLSLSNEIDYDFANYLFRDRTMVSHYVVCSKGVGTIQRNLYWPQLKRVNVCLPPLPEQTAIAHFLDRKTALIDQAIDIKQKQIELLKERRQILIHKAVTRGLNPKVKMKDSGVEWIGEIPEGWEVKPLKHLGYVFPGITGKSGEDFSKEYSEGMKPFIPFTNIFKYDVISNEEFQYVKIRDTEKQNKVNNNDLLFLMSSETLEDIGKCSIYLGSEKQLYLNSFCKGFRITALNIEPTFINALLLSNPYRNYFSVVGRGFTRMNIKQEYVNHLPILIPKIDEQKEIIGYVNMVNSKIKSAISLKEQEIEYLKEYKATLINSAVTGKLRVPSV